MRSFLLMLALAVSTVRGDAQKTFTALLTNNPAPEHREKLMLFGQFVGSWKFSGFEYHDDGARVTDRGEIHFRWVLQGRAIQDVWLETSRSDSAQRLYGTTIRFYDPKIDSWKNTFIDPEWGVVTTLNGNQVGSEIVLLGTGSDGSPIRWIFSDIKQDSFHWRAEKRNGKQWQIYEELWTKRL